MPLNKKEIKLQLFSSQESNTIQVCKTIMSFLFAYFIDILSKSLLGSVVTQKIGCMRIHQKDRHDPFFNISEDTFRLVVI